MKIHGECIRQQKQIGGWCKRGHELLPPSPSKGGPLSHFHLFSPQSKHSLCRRVSNNAPSEVIFVQIFLGETPRPPQQCIGTPISLWWSHNLPRHSASWCPWWLCAPPVKIFCIRLCPAYIRTNVTNLFRLLFEARFLFNIFTEDSHSRGYYYFRKPDGSVIKTYAAGKLPFLFEYLSNKYSDHLWGSYPRSALYFIAFCAWMFGDDLKPMCIN